ncbi:hypothetical protein BEN47_03440 [Hymenobacter lapidarius]|uniref:Peptidase M56 domain-containing protein n=1 Tax=Hymenobacter lapidarius TaxID=1908237 RepID=A0A1G1SXK6_9BACT|nr:M56 family metallopeptidase [Hymenobacter lapidarius]OGX83357.1 hypothetical protein BEN47_03440 [Hymenobacter lapidarius]
MAPTLLYLLKANVALLLFAAAYFGLLRRLTFFTLNRFYLLFALVFSAAYPVLPLPALFPEAASLPVAFTVLATAGGPSEAAPVAAAASIDWEHVGLVLYAGGAAVLLGRLLVQLLSLWRVRRNSQAAVLHGQAVRTLAGAVSPFSFWQTIYLNPAWHPVPELAAVLRHEQVHVQQWHTLDVLLAQVAQALAWCNPAAWLLRRALLDNLEYLADHAALQTGLDRRAYQYSLLRLSHGVAGPSLVSHFTFPTLKNRVAMMNTPLSSTGQLTRYIVAGPLVLAVALGFSAAQAQGAGPKVPVGTATAATAVEPVGLSRVYYLDGKPTTLRGKDDLFGDVATMKILKDAQVQQVLGNGVDADWAIMITTNKNRNRADLLALNAKVDAAGALDTKFKLGPAVDPAKHQLPAGIKAYIAKTYPNAKLVSWAISEKPSAKAPFVKYLAAVKEDDRRVQLYFNEAEQPVQVAKPTSQRQEPASATEAVVAKALSASPGQAAGTPPIVYVDGKRTTTDINAISPSSIASISVLKGESARQLAGDAGAEGVILITTKENQDAPEVQAFNAKYGAAAPAPAVAETPKSVAYLAPEALLYITKTYPGARLLGVSEVPGVNGGATRYQAEIVLGRRPGYLLFDAQGKFISDSYTSNAR